MKLHLRNVLSVNSDTSAVGIVESAQQIDDCCLTGTGRSHDRDRLSLIHMKADILQDRNTILIAEGYMLKVNISLNLRHFDGIRLVCDLHRFIDCLEDTFQIGNCRQHAVIKAGNRVDRLPESGNIGGKHNKHTNRNAGGSAAHNAGNTDHIHKGGRDHGDQIYHRAHHKVIINSFEPRLLITHA